jgi:hypothetical protein
VDYTYDPIGQLKTATGKESGGSPTRLQEKLGYVYDLPHEIIDPSATLGTRQVEAASCRAKAGSGLSHGASQGNLQYRTNNATVQTFNVNSLNELTTVTRSGTITAAGAPTIAASSWSKSDEVRYV